MWVLNIPHDFSKITFLDPLMNKKYELSNRIVDKKGMHMFLKQHFKSENEIKDYLKEKLEKEEKEKKKLEEEIRQKEYENNKNLNSIQKTYSYSNTNRTQTNPNEFLEKPVEKTDILEQLDLLNVESDVKIQNEIKINSLNPDDNANKLINEIYKLYNHFNQISKEKTDKLLSCKYFEPIKTSSIDSDEILPYKTIDFIFNKSNIFVNLQNADPVKIFFDIFHPSLWSKLIYSDKPVMVNDEEIDKKNNQFEKKQLTNVLISDKYFYNEDIPPFYTYKTINNTYNKEDINIKVLSIKKSLKDCIRKIRMEKNLTTQYLNVNLF
jgi:hypothetical protein